MIWPHRSRYGRPAAAFTDQVVSSATNFLVVVLGARVLGADDFGTFSVGLVVVTLVVACVRGLILEPVLVEAAAMADARRSTVALGFSAALLPALAASTGIAVVFGDWMYGGAILLFSLTAVVQDAGRYLALSAGRAGVALMSDAVWCVAVLIAIATVTIGSLQQVVMINVLAVALATIVIPLFGVTGYSFVGVAVLYRQVAVLGRRLLLEQGLALASLQVAVLGAGVIGGIRLAGSARGAVAIMGPLNTLNQAFYLVTVPRLRRSTSAHQLRRSAVNVTLAMAGAASAYIVVLFWVIGDHGQVLLGDTWESVHAARVPLSAAMVMGAVSVGPYFVLRAVHDGRSLVRMRVISSPVMLVVAFLGVLLGDLEGFLWGLSVGLLVQGIVTWMLCGAFLRAPDRSTRQGESVGSGAERRGPALRSQTTTGESD